MAETKKKQPKIEVIIYPLKPDDNNAVYMLFKGDPRNIDMAHAKNVLHCNEWIDLTALGRTDLIPTIRGGGYLHRFRVDGKPVPKAINEVEVGEEIHEKAEYQGDSPAALKKRPDITDEERALYEYIQSF